MANANGLGFGHYAVIGNPVAHSRSPFIHTAFARQTGQEIRYDKLEAPLAGFVETVADFFANGGAGCNVTIPFKEAACQFANQLTPRAQLAGAVNTLWLDDDGVVGDNTDGIGLVRDLQRHTTLKNKSILLLGAGGAARGIIAPLLAEQPASLCIANRTADKALVLAEHFRDVASNRLATISFEALQASAVAYDVVINATSASLAGQGLPLPDSIWHSGSMAYDLMYSASETAFLRQARAGGASLLVDGLGMLVEQAAEAFFLWRGVMPNTAPVLAELAHTLRA